MKNILYTILASFLILTSCSMKNNKTAESHIRGVVDTVGFAHLDWQMDTVISEINSTFAEKLIAVAQPEETTWKLAICPHDDYTYASWLYPAVLKNIKAKTIIIFGVAHKARNFNLGNKLVFDSFDYWSGPYGNIRVSGLREDIIDQLPGDSFIVHDSMQTVEHSVEALIPFLQYQNRDVEIISILVPHSDLNTIDKMSTGLSTAIASVLKSKNLNWGNDVALLITSDAVHYGDEEWGGNNYARFGTDSFGYQQALAYEQEIIDTCLSGLLSLEKAEKFYQYTVSPDNFMEYIWTWCGRYCIPTGMETAQKLSTLLNEKPLTGILIGYSTSIGQEHIPVDQLGMGVTAVAQPRHWVGYPAVGFK